MRLAPDANRYAYLEEEDNLSMIRPCPRTIAVPTSLFESLGVSPENSESTLLNQLSSSWSTSPTLSTNVPPGLAPDGYNLTIAVSVSDFLGSVAATNLGADGIPMVITSTPPQEVRWGGQQTHFQENLRSLKTQVRSWLGRTLSSCKNIV